MRFHGLPASFFAALALSSFAAPPPAEAASKGGVTMPDSVQVDGKTLVLNGLGIREATVLNVDVYVAGLYLEAKSKDAKAIIEADAPKRIAMKFVRDVDKADLTEAFEDGFKKNGGAAFSAQVAKLKAMLGDAKEGQEWVLTYVPGKGTEVKGAGKVKGTIEGAGFQKVLFKIWLGPNPPNAGLKTGLLGG